jgi:hypothetical protein
MKTLTVKQVAECLGVSPRAVIKRLNNEQLKGTRRPNKYGVEEWWVYPNKEIRAALESAGKSDILIDDGVSPADAEVVDVETENFSPDQDDQVNEEETETPQATFERVKGSAIAEELWNNIIGKFVGQLQERDMLIGEMRSEIAEKDRQLKLLPDLQKQAEKERKEAELYALEGEALKKQISALQEQIDERLSPEMEKQLKDEKAVKELELANLQREMEKERAQRELELSALKGQLAAIDEYKKLAEEAKTRLDELQKTIEEREHREDSEKTAALEEVRRLQEEKSKETAAIREELAALSRKLEKPQQQSWWKKWFSWSQPEN